MLAIDVLQKQRETTCLYHLESDQRVAYLNLFVVQPVLALTWQAWLSENLYTGDQEVKLEAKK